MTNEDICGYEGTHDGEPCGQPAGDNGRCWIPTHNPTPDGGSAENPQGPPSIKDDVADDIFDAARTGASMAGCARAAGIHKSTLYDWLDTDSPRYDPEFETAFMKARWQGEKRLLQNPDDVDARHAQFILERSFDYTKEQTIEHEGDAANVTIDFSDVDT